MVAVIINPIVGSYGDIIELPIPQKKWVNEFIGWTDINGKYFTSVIVPHNDITLYANWEANSYTITFDTQGGTLIAPITAPFGSKIINR